MFICIFYIIIGIVTTMMLNETGLKTKWPFYLTIWSILLSYIILETFQAFLYVNDEYFNIFPENFNTFEAQLFGTAFHEGLIFVALFMIVWHTDRINEHTIMLLK